MKRNALHLSAGFFVPCCFFLTLCQNFRWAKAKPTAFTYRAFQKCYFRSLSDSVVRSLSHAQSAFSSSSSVARHCQFPLCVEGVFMRASLPLRRMSCIVRMHVAETLFIADFIIAFGRAARFSSIRQSCRCRAFPCTRRNFRCNAPGCSRFRPSCRTRTVGFSFRGIPFP